MSPLATGILIGFLALFVLLAVTSGRLVIPGIVPFLVFAASVKPYRGCVVTTAGIFLLQTSIENHQPKKVLAQVPFGALFPPNIVAVTKRAVRVRLDPDLVSLRASDYERLTASISDAEKGGILAIPDGRLV